MISTKKEDWSPVIWYKCLECKRCFEFQERLISHKNETSCGIVAPTKETHYNNSLEEEMDTIANSKLQKEKIYQETETNKNKRNKMETLNDNQKQHLSIQNYFQQVSSNVKLIPKRNLESFQCYFCHEKYTYYSYFEIHLRSHTLENPYRCSRKRYQSKSEDNNTKSCTDSKMDHSFNETESGTLTIQLGPKKSTLTTLNILNHNSTIFVESGQSNPINNEQKEITVTNGIDTLKQGLSFPNFAQQVMSKSTSNKPLQKVKVNKKPKNNGTSENNINIVKYDLRKQRSSFQNPSKEFVCKSMVKLFKSSKQVKNPDSFICKDCGKQFINSRALKLHSIVHSEVKPWKSKICKKRFCSEKGFKNSSKRS